jgi:hypothetical protein
MSAPWPRVRKDEGFDLIANERTTFRVQDNVSVSQTLSGGGKLLDALNNTPTRFLEPDFISAAPELKAISDRIAAQESAVASELGPGSPPGKVRALLPDTERECTILLNELAGRLSPFVPVSRADLSAQRAFDGRTTLSTLNPAYYLLLSQGRWFEVVASRLVYEALSATRKRFELRHDVRVLGHTGLWHEIDILLVTREYSVCAEAKSGGWGRNDLLKLLAQRGDIGCDSGALLTLEVASENFAPLVRAQPIRTFRMVGKASEEFGHWLTTLVD